MSSATAMISLLIDSFVIGRLLGSRALSAYGLANPLLIVYAAIGNMLVCGVQVVCGKSMGRGDKEETNASFSSSVVIALALSAPAVVVVMAAWRPISCPRPRRYIPFGAVLTKRKKLTQNYLVLCQF